MTPPPTASGAEIAPSEPTPVAAPPTLRPGCPGLAQERILAFACEYCAYAAADLAGALRLQYPANVRVVKIPCTGRVDTLMLLRAFRRGFDAVFVAGCQPGDCHFLKGNYRAVALIPRVKQLLAESGLHPDRLEFFHMAASEAHRWVTAVEEMTARVRRLGPSPLRTGGGPEGGTRSEE